MRRLWSAHASATTWRRFAFTPTVSKPKYVDQVVVLATCAAAAGWTGLTSLVAFTVVLEAAWFFAMTTSIRCVARSVVGRRWWIINFGLEQSQQFFSLLVWLSVLTTAALAPVWAKKSRPKTIAIQFEAACTATVTWLVAGRICDWKRLWNCNIWQLRTNWVDIDVSKQKLV